MKFYNESFKDDGLKDVIKLIIYIVKNLVLGFKYDFEVYVSFICGKSFFVYLKVEIIMEGEYFLGIW